MAKKVIKELIEGNADYDIEESISQKIKSGQSPKITLVTCSDSRVSGHIMKKDMVNYVFHIRNIGNQIENNFGSVDYGIEHLHTPILLILGHTDCGAVKASQSDFSKETDEIRQELFPLYFNLSKAAEALDKEDPKYITKLVQANVDKQVWLAKRRYGDKTNVIGAIFDLHEHMAESQGRIIITNINGTTDEDEIKALDIMEELEDDLKDAVVKRL